MKLPDDLWRVIVTFSEEDLLGLLRLRLVNKQFNHAMKHPSVVSDMHFNFTFHRKVASCIVSDVRSRTMPHDWLGPLTVGVRRASIHNAEPFQSLAMLSNLQHLTLFHSCIGSLPMELETISLNWCYTNHGAEFQRALCKTLEINYGAYFDFDLVSHMVWLENLKLKDAPISNLNFAQTLESLRSLCVSECRQLENVSAVKSLLSLQTLQLQYCPQLVDIDSLVQLTSLTELSLLECHNIKSQDVQSVVNRLPKLTHLWILHHGLKELTLANLPNLTHLCLYDCIELIDLREWPIGLLELNLENCYRLADFSELTRLFHLRDLNLESTSISVLPNLPLLRDLNVNNCDNLTDDGLLGVLPCADLRSVFMHNCELLSDHIEELLDLRSTSA